MIGPKFRELSKTHTDVVCTCVMDGGLGWGQGRGWEGRRLSLAGRVGVSLRPTALVFFHREPLPVCICAGPRAVLSVDVDEGEEIAEKYDVSAMPVVRGQ
jgi:hypothetical protein